MLRTTKYCLVMVMMLVAAADVHASFMPTLAGSPTFANGSTTFTYNLRFSTNGNTDSLNYRDFVTIYDVYAFPTVLSIVSNATDIAVSTQLTGITPPNVMPTDNPSLYNITFTYVGATLTTDTSFSVSLALTGNYTGAPHVGQYASTDTTALGPNNQIGPVLVPTVAVPEPSSLLLCGIAGCGVLGAWRARRG